MLDVCALIQSYVVVRNTLVIILAACLAYGQHQRGHDDFGVVGNIKGGLPSVTAPDVTIAYFNVRLV